MRQWGLVGALILLVSVGGCAATGNGNGDGIGHNPITDDAASGANAPAPEPLSPFDEFRSILWGMDRDEDAVRRQFEADRIVEENMIAQCMHELGFEYIPYPDAVELVFRENENWRPNDPDWIAQYGYGWVVEPAGGRPIDGHGVSVSLPGPGNPNYAILEELSETERQAWSNSLMNMGAGFEREVPGVGIMRDCFNWARMTVNAQRFYRGGDEFTPLFDAIEQMQVNLRHDISDADRAWSNCMADNGFPGIDRQWEATDTILREMSATRSAVAQDAEWQALNPNANPTVDNSTALAELHEREINMATADHDCQISTDFAANREAHIFAVENQFISDHRTTLEALRSAFEQQ